MATPVHRYEQDDRPWEKHFAPVLADPPQKLKYSRASTFEQQRLYKEPAPPKQRYAIEDGRGSSLSAADIRAIVQALESLDWVQAIKEFLRETHGNNSGFDQQAEPPDVPEERQKREQYARSRKNLEAYQRQLKHLRRAHPDDRRHQAPDVLTEAHAADERYRQSRAAIAARIRDCAERYRLSYDDARAKLGEAEPLPLLPAAVA